ncbi:MAG: transcription termination factor NusA [Bdellovibrionota bacterium]
MSEMPGLGNLSRVIDSVVKDKGIDRQIVVTALEQAILAAAKKKIGTYREIEAQYNEEIGEVELFEFRKVVENVEDDELEVSVDEAKKLDPEAQIGDDVGMKISLGDFGRIAAQTAKQVIIQKIRDAERDIIFNEYKDRVGEVVHGIVRRFEKGDIIVDIGRTEAVLPRREQVPRESYRPGDRVRAYILDVNRAAKGPQVILSRATPKLVERLFEVEVPEMAEGIVQIVQIAREPGARTKIAVTSKDSSVDPVGACVGMKGSRVQAVVQELRGEKIDIIVHDPEVARFAVNALAPAEVLKVFVDEDDKTLQILVADDQLSLAIGRRGQNVRLASQLLGWKIDMKSESEFAAEQQRAKADLGAIEGISPVAIELLYLEGYRSVEEVADMPIEELQKIEGIEAEMAQKILDGAKARVKWKKENPEPVAPPPATEPAQPAATESKPS